MTRQAVGDDATRPNRSACSRSTPRSARQSPPSAMLTIRSLSTTPGSWAERRWRYGAIPVDSARVQPKVSANSARAALPAWLAIPAPSTATTSLLRRLVGFTCKVLSLDGCWDVWKHPNPISGEPFFFLSELPLTGLTEISGLGRLWRGPPNYDTREVSEASGIHGHDLSVAGGGRGGDDQVMGAPGSAATKAVSEQPGVYPCHLEVVVFNRHSRENLFHESASDLAVLRVCHL